MLFGLQTITWLGAGAIGVASGSLALALSSADTAVAAALKTRLPKTEVAKIDCKAIDGLCEVTAGKSIFYVDRSARYLIVGRVFDMETRQDLTSARLLEINPEALLGGATRRSEDDDGDPKAIASAQGRSAVARDYPMPKAAGTAGAGSPVASDSKVSLASLPASGAITWGRGSTKVTVFTDFRCGYCRALTTALETMDVTVVERPISVLGTRELTNRVYCAKDRPRALHAAYAGRTPPTAATCDTSGLDANEAFARKNGFSGTPVIVRSDGAVLHGYRPKEFLAAWLKGAKS